MGGGDPDASPAWSFTTETSLPPKKKRGQLHQFFFRSPLSPASPKPAADSLKPCRCFRDIELARRPFAPDVSGG
jgi:hypothetical protein